jgi:poly(3-hydroxybutyrate) depolymerase
MRPCAPSVLFLAMMLPVAAQNANFTPAWPPTLDTTSTITKTLDGRTIEHYVHGQRESWGYPTPVGTEWAFHAAGEDGAQNQNHNTFYLIAPKVPRDNAPLCVVLHSANRTAYNYLSFDTLGVKADGVSDPTTVMTHCPDDFYALYLNSTNNEWWGWNAANQSAAFKDRRNEPSYVEKRVLDTIEWIVQQHHIDRNRIYLCGVSMGGCGTLGIGMPNGNIFAAIRAAVPAGTNYASYRFGGPAGIGPIPALNAPAAEFAAWKKRAAGAGLPDPPVICDFSSQEDGWANTEPPLVYAAEYGHLPFVLTWGRFGHATFAERMFPETKCQVGLAFPYLEVRKNEAYAVFTHATCNDVCPWINGPVEFNINGVMNAYFRWKAVEDTPASFKIQVWIAHPTIPGPTAAEGQPPGENITMPDRATADVTPRRLQRFKVTPGSAYTWTATQDGKVVASGSVTPDLANLLTLPKIPLGLGPTEISIH